MAKRATLNYGGLSTVSIGEGAMDEQTPKVWHATILARSMVEFQWMLGTERYGPYFRNPEALRDLLTEQKRISDRLNIMYLLTFAGACLVMLGPLPSGAKFSAIGLEAPISIIPQQVVAVVMAVLYGMFCTHFASLMVLTQMVGEILKLEGAETWQFFAARYDASGLWATLLMRRTIGYQSPRRHIVIAVMILLTAILGVLVHGVVVVTSAFIDLHSAIEHGPWYLILFALLATFICLVAAGSIVGIMAMRLPFRMQEATDAQPSQPPPDQQAV